MWFTVGALWIRHASAPTSTRWLLIFLPIFNQVILGFGSPLAWHTNEATPPEMPVWFTGNVMKLGRPDEDDVTGQISYWHGGSEWWETLSVGVTILHTHPEKTQRSAAASPAAQSWDTRPVCVLVSHSCLCFDTLFKPKQSLTLNFLTLKMFCITMKHNFVWSGNWLSLSQNEEKATTML